MCERSLCANLSIDNVCETLILADLHSAEQLRRYSTEFLNSHAQEIVDTTSFKTMTSTHPHLLAGAFKALASQQNAPSPFHFANAASITPPKKRFKPGA
uniref:BPM/SPOP BACK domain-containing protein n=1 Tax=Romanomermis culicivorax TaxID=13658 RepID=A0A915IE61_ROMCU